MRSSTPEVRAARAAGAPQCVLIRMDLVDGSGNPAPLYVSSTGFNFEYDGKLWLGGALVASIEEVTETAGERHDLRFGLSSVPTEMIALALSHQVRGKRCRMWLATLHPETYAVMEVRLLWTGSLDRMREKNGLISVTAVHRGETFSRPKPSRYTHAEQQRLHPGDLSLEFITSQSTHQDVWPAASWGKK